MKSYGVTFKLGIRISNLGISSFKKQCEDYYKNIGFDRDNLRATWVS